MVNFLTFEVWRRKSARSVASLCNEADSVDVSRMPPETIRELSYPSTSLEASVLNDADVWERVRQLTRDETREVREGLSRVKDERHRLFLARQRQRKSKEMRGG